ncbi:M56 family metallopeptidase [Peribacillus butanolivorans]|uniref:M56 family metallopeptidase n=1 Tax=Peribacillus butanolivorans TaxID=421767 RepID=UPI0035DCB882
MSILNMGVDASLLLIIVLLMRMLVRNKVPKQTFLILWGIVACKLLIPYSFYSKLSIQPMLKNLSVTLTHSNDSESMQNTIEIAQTSSTFYHQLLLVMTSDFVQYLWACGGIGVLLFFIVAYVRLYKEFQTAIPVKNNEYLDQWLNDHKLKRTIQIAVSDRITTPLTYGIFKPVILLPKSTNWEDTANIQFILTHELIHIKRFDVLWKVILTIMVALHWFNPLVWLMYFLVNRDIELSCDERVIRQFGDKAKSAYALSLINMADETYTVTPLCNHFSKNGIEERIVSIMTLKKKSVLGTAFACTLVIGGMTAFAATGQEPLTLKEGKERNAVIVTDASNSTTEPQVISTNKGKERNPVIDTDASNSTTEPHVITTNKGKERNPVIDTDASNSTTEPHVITTNKGKERNAVIHTDASNSTTEPRVIATNEE